MKTIYLEQDEWYPVYIFGKKGQIDDHKAIISERDYNRYVKLFKDFDKIQEELMEIYEKVDKENIAKEREEAVKRMNENHNYDYMSTDCSGAPPPFTIQYDPETGRYY